MATLNEKQQAEAAAIQQRIRSLLGGVYLNKDLCLKQTKPLKTHALGLIPEKLINERRPSEPEEIKEYRKKIYVPKTKQAISKVINSLEKIRRSQDWNIQYDADTTPKSIVEQETLEAYCEQKYPAFTSLTNWAFSELLKQYLLDPNGIIAIVPETLPQTTAEYIRPVAKFFSSEQIVDYVENEYIVLQSNDRTVRTTATGQKQVNQSESIYYLLTPYEVARFTQGSKTTDENAYYLLHNIGTIPAVKAGGLFHARVNNDTIFESRIAGMIPSLDEAAREYSDLQAEIVQHIHSEKYVYTNTECPDCKGSGSMVETDNDGSRHTHTCKRCNGSGSVMNVSPYGVHLIHGTQIGESAIPTPPIGYVQKNTEIARLQDERVKQHIYDALAAVNMEFLAETPIAQSGTAKAYDRDELNNFVNGVAEDIVRLLDCVYYYICEYRYSIIVPDPQARRAMLPKINVPTKYDILNTSTLMAELQAARNAKVNPMITRELEIDYCKKQFNTSPEIAKAVETTFDLDPLFGVSEEDKMTMLANGGITETDYIISCNICAFVRRAAQEHKDFYNSDYKRKNDILKQYAAEVQKQNEPKTTSPLPNFNDLDEPKDDEESDQEDEENEGEEKDPQKRPVSHEKDKDK